MSDMGEENGNMVQLISVGAYVPKNRIRTEDIARVWKKDGPEIVGGLKVVEKTVPDTDEDAVTVAFEAASRCLRLSTVPMERIGALFVGSESHPYAVNPTATIVGEFLGLSHRYHAADMEFACKAGTAGVQAVAAMVASGQIEFGLAIGADTAQSKPHDVLEYTSACAGVAMLLGKTGGIAKLLSYRSFTSDTPDFWRRDGMRYPSHAGRFTGEPAYFNHVMGAARLQFEETGTTPADYTYCVFHMPNGRFPREVAKRLGFTEAQLAPSLTVDTLGNPYSASSMLGLSAVLDVAKPGERIFMVSYGSGAGSDGFVFETTPEVDAFRARRTKNRWRLIDEQDHKRYIDYVEYLKQTHKI